MTCGHASHLWPIILTFIGLKSNCETTCGGVYSYPTRLDLNFVKMLSHGDALDYKISVNDINLFCTKFWFFELRINFKLTNKKNQVTTNKTWTRKPGPDPTKYS